MLSVFSLYRDYTVVDDDNWDIEKSITREFPALNIGTSNLVSFSNILLTFVFQN